MKTVSNPYVGPNAFLEGDAHLFFGRDREVESLSSLVIAESIVLFFAQSGTGKTSLLQARLLPGLKDGGFDVLPVARVGAEPAAGATPANVYVFSALCSLAPDTDPVRLQSLTLSAYLWTLPERDGRKTRRFIVFDQFEEILAPRSGRWEDREGFFLQLRQALEDEPSLSVLLVMREDNLAALEPFAPLLPGKLRTRFRMESLRVEDAVAAVAMPVRQARPFDPGVAERLVDDLRRVEVDGSAGSYRGELVEPLQLQVVCYELWEKLGERPGETITGPDLAACGDIGQALESFYERAIQRASERSGVPPERLRAWCGKALITPRRLRGQVDRAETSTAGLENRAVDALVETRLVREQPIRGGRWYELVHDRFIEPVLRVNERHLQAESTPLRRDAQKWRASGPEPDPSFLYSGQKLEEALRTNRPDDEALSDLERDFLLASQAWEAKQSIEREKQAVRLREQAVRLGDQAAKLTEQAAHLRQKSARLKWLAGALAVLLVTAGGLAAYSYSTGLQSKSRELAVRASTRLDADPDEGLRLAVEAAETAETPEAEAALHKALNASRLRRFWWAPMKSASAVAFSSDGSRLAAVGDNGEADLWDVQHGQVVARLSGNTGEVTCVAFSPDGRWLATGDSEGKIILRRASGEQLPPSIVVGKVSVNGLAFSPDGQTLAVASDSPVPRLWDVETRRELEKLKEQGDGSEGAVWDVAFSGDGRFLASGGGDGRVIEWTLATRAPRVLGALSGRVTSVAFQPVERGKPPTLLASSGGDSTVRLWDLRSGASTPLFGHRQPVLGVAFSRDGAYLAASSSDGKIKAWEVSSQQELFTLSAGDNEVAKVVFGPQPDLLATASHRSRTSEEGATGAVTVWRFLLRDETETLLRKGQVRAIAFTKDGKLRVEGQAAVQGGVPVLNGKVIAASYSPAGPLLATLEPREGMKLWALQGGSWKEAGHFGEGMPLRAVALSQDGKRLAVGRGDGVVIVLSTDGQSPPWMLPCHQSPVVAVAFSSDGNRLATGSVDRTAKLWDLKHHGLEIATFEGHQAPVASVAFNSDGTVLATGDNSGRIRLEVLGLQELMARARRRLAQSLDPKERRR